MNTYEFSLSAICPNQPTLRDAYEVRIESPEMIEVEKFLEFSKWIRDAKYFQEELADLLYGKFHCRVEIRGSHLEVKVTCVRE